MKNQLPSPEPLLLAHTEQVKSAIIDKIRQAGRAISFADYMQLALYAPGLGYYTSGNYKLGRLGDFITAPELSPLFSYCLARQCQAIIRQIKDAAILEFGAGSGVMARDILHYLAKHESLPTNYYILEISPELKQRQQILLQDGFPQYSSQIIWLDALPAKGFKGIVLANEVLDAMPVTRFKIENNIIYEIGVNVDEKQNFIIELMPASSKLQQTIHEISQLFETPFTQNYESEINLLLPAWINSISHCLEQAVILLLDYGFPRHEYYHPQRTMGTLMCHYQHYAHPDPLLYPGIQDITAHVDFSAVAESAVAANLNILGYTNQANFLLNCGLDQVITEYASSDEVQNYKFIQQVKRLTHPSDMGELFKVIALGHDFKSDLCGFHQRDLRNRL